MTKISIQRNLNVPMLVVADKKEAFELLSMGFSRQNSYFRLVFLEKENEWLLMGQIRDAMKNKFYMDMGIPVDYT